jgi:8-oxo-dGTP pyrophosphatase MutT (NUDIX family)
MTRQAATTGAELPQRVTNALDRLLDGPSRTHPVADAAVLLLLGPGCGDSGDVRGPCLILNRRSGRVRQPGDLCFPGGRVQLPLDRWLGRLLRLPGSPLTRWRGWAKRRGGASLPLLLAAALRESAEEMRLNPLGVDFLGPLPPQPLVLFRRLIAPMVCWVPRQRRFFPNWEVEQVVCVALEALLQPERYARLRLEMTTAQGAAITRDFPCFRLSRAPRRDVLWGATFRITMDFLGAVYGFQPPPLDTRPMIAGRLAASYGGTSRR